MDIAYEKRSSWLDRPLLTTIVINAETVLFAAILILAIVTRFYDLGTRVMSHDENSHVYYSWKLYRGEGFAHDPLMHGPFQFHMLAMSYFMFGDSDFSARIPAILFSIATVAFVWNLRRYLGRTGALVAAFLMVISPYMLFYGRYVRNEAFVALFGVVTLWAILRYMETGQARFMYWLVAATALHFTTKETSFIYTAQALLFLAFYLVHRLTINPWRNTGKRSAFLLALIAAALLLGGAFALSRFSGGEPAGIAEGAVGAATGSLPLIPLLLAGGALIALGAAAVIVLQGYGLSRLREERSFDLLILLGTLVLPHLTAFPMRLFGWFVPDSAGEVLNLSTTDMVRIALALVPMFLISAAIGLWWRSREWLVSFGIFYAIFIVFFTTVFTNGAGFITGVLGSLGYWLEQQGVNRGNQPWYYYWLIQVPVYEYLPLLGSLLAFGLVLFRSLRPSKQEDTVDETPAGAVETEGEESLAPLPQRPPVVALLGFWVITSIVAYTIAGEKMPWLTVHITLPMILLAGWGFGALIDSVNWDDFRAYRGWLVLVLLPIFIASFAAALGAVLGASPPFRGNELDQLRATSTFLTAFITAVASGVSLAYLVRPWPVAQFYRILALAGFAFLALLTMRTAFTASYINYDNANELLVYAHSAGGVKQALAQIEEISRRTTNGLALQVAYDNETSYPYLWYLRNYPNAQYFGETPSRTLREVPVILVGDSNYSKIEPVVGQAFYQFDYTRLWWPNQDYYNLTWERINNALTNPQMREALFEIWLNRDYTLFGQATNQDLSLPNWYPSERMRLYIRKDIVAQLWNYGLAPAAEEIVADPYEGKQANLVADRTIGAPGTEPGQFTRPRGVVVAEDGSLYVTDTENHRIQHLAADGSVLQVWGSFGDSTTGQAPGGTFNQPWGIALGPDGSVYVADTWNHRVQKFSPEGEFLTTWGYFGQAEQPEAFWGPRDVAVDDQGWVFVTDTGNKRIVVFDENGSFLTQFGTAGLAVGEFDEPVGLALDSDGRLYVADTWNQRVQVFAPQEDGSFQPALSWEVVGWYGQSLDNKPYLAVNDAGHVFVADPEGARVLEFTQSGEFVRFWGDFGSGPGNFSMVGDLSPDGQGGLWVVDTGNNRLLHFPLDQ